MEEVRGEKREKEERRKKGREREKDVSPDTQAP